MSDAEQIKILVDTEAIKRLKHKYLRCLDCKLWDEIRECLSDDIEASFMGGAMEYHGLEELIKFYRDALPAHRITTHLGHRPEIDIIDESNGRGTWAVQTYLIDTQFNIALDGMSIFHELYVKHNGVWKIKSTSCYRLFEEMFNRADIATLKLTQVYRFDSQAES
jgi:hypothetical protein